jgi:hypothetical protein
MPVYSKECPRSIENTKILLKYISLQLKENITLGGGGFVFNIKYSSIKPVPHSSMKIYEYHHKTLKLQLNELIVTYLNSQHLTTAVLLAKSLEQFNRYSATAVVTICCKTFTYLFATKDITAPYSTLCYQDHSHVSCGCSTQYIRQSVHCSLQLTELISASMNSKQSAKDTFQSFGL